MTYEIEAKFRLEADNQQEALAQAMAAVCIECWDEKYGLDNAPPNGAQGLVTIREMPESQNAR